MKMYRYAKLLRATTNATLYHDIKKRVSTLRDARKLFINSNFNVLVENLSRLLFSYARANNFKILYFL